jgi:hypothetical protein
MSKLILALALVMFGASSFAVETKKVCVEQTDAKTKKVKEVCKDVKIHKKLEGTAVPDKKAK